MLLEVEPNDPALFPRAGSNAPAWLPAPATGLAPAPAPALPWLPPRWAKPALGKAANGQSERYDDHYCIPSHFHVTPRLELGSKWQGR